MKGGVENFGSYRKSMALFDLVLTDMDAEKRFFFRPINISEISQCRLDRH